MMNAASPMGDPCGGSITLQKPPARRAWGKP